MKAKHVKKKASVVGFEPAPVTDRAFAYIIDCVMTFLVLRVVVAVVFVFLWLAIEFEMPGGMIGTISDYVILFLSSFLYFTCYEAILGTTSGKKAFNLRVLKADGQKIGWKEAALRNITKSIPYLFLVFMCIGLLTISVRKDRRKFEDHLSGTIVVKQML